MPNTRIPPDEGTFSAYYREIETHDWYASLPEHDRSLLNSIKIEADKWGQCGCGRTGELYTVSFSDLSDIACKRCFKKKILNMSDYMYTVYQAIEQMSHLDDVFPYSSLPKHADERNVCVGCNLFIFTASDYDVPSRVVVSQLVEHEGVTHTVHTACTWDCTECKKSHLSSYNTPHIIDGARNVCSPCLDVLIDADEVSRCAWCRKYLVELHYSHDRDLDLCQACFNSSWSCDDCGHSMEEGEEHECYRSNGSLIYDYSYKPDNPKFFGEADYHFGLEIEVEDTDGYGVEEGAEVVLNSLNDRAYIKHDSSLDDGFEIVTEPHSLDQLENLDWDFLRTLRSRGYRSWDTGTCGIHVHVSRTAFRNAGKHNEAHELRFQKLIYDNASQVRTIAGRTSHYAQFQDKGNLVMKVKHGQSADRYEAINSQNTHTLEVRVFRGSLKKTRILSAVEFIHSAVEYTRFMKIDPKAKQLSWFRFMGYVLDNQDKYANFTQIALRDMGTNPDYSTERENA